MVDESRRAFFAKLLPKAAQAVAAPLQERIDAVLPRERRPPGALEEAAFLAACTGCGDCVTACPYGALFVFTAEAGIKAKTPILQPEIAPCHMCNGTPCAAACETPALTVPENPAVWIGTVAIDKARCIAFMGPECGACVGVCPDGVKAIRLERWRPAVDTETCVGCGLCIHACPVLPSAIGMVAL